MRILIEALHGDAVGPSRRQGVATPASLALHATLRRTAPAAARAR
jgi:hypothetical protein